MNVESVAAAGTDPRIAFFDRHAPTWDATGPDPAATLRRLRELNRQLGFHSGQNLLEAGCGTGQITGWLVETVRPGRVVAADFSPAMLARARQRGLDAEFREWDVCQEWPAKERFDVVFCFNAFAHFRDKPAALRHIAPLLEPTAVLVVLHLSGSAKLNAFHGSLGEPVCLDLLPRQEAWGALLAGAGLRLASLTDQDDLFLLKAQRAPGPIRNRRREVGG